jgi:anti-anti-sigma regulatory factor
MTLLFKAPARLDAEQVKTMRFDFDRLASSNDDVVVDLARTEVLDGSGVGAMVFAFKRLSLNGKRLSVRNVSGQPLNLLNDSGLLRTLSGERQVSRVAEIVRSLRLERMFGRTQTVKSAPMPDLAVMQVEAERTKGAA